MENKKIVGMYETKEEAVAYKLKLQSEGFHETFVLTGVGLFPEKFNVLQSRTPKEKQKPYENTPKLHIDIASILLLLMGAVEAGDEDEHDYEHGQYNEGVLEQLLWNYTLMEQLAPNDPTYLLMKQTPNFQEMLKKAQNNGSMCSCGSGFSFF